jgi:hypothetical protein
MSMNQNLLYKKLLESLGNRAAPTDQNRLVILCVEHCPWRGGRGGHGSDGVDLSTSYLRGTASWRSKIKLGSGTGSVATGGPAQSDGKAAKKPRLD